MSKFFKVKKANDEKEKLKNRILDKLRYISEKTSEINLENKLIKNLFNRLNLNDKYIDLSINNNDNINKMYTFIMNGERQETDFDESEF